MDSERSGSDCEGDADEEGILDRGGGIDEGLECELLRCEERVLGLVKDTGSVDSIGRGDE